MVTVIKASMLLQLSSAVILEGPQRGQAFGKITFSFPCRFHQFHPFLCAADFKKIASLYGSDKFDLPYGIRTSGQ